MALRVFSLLLALFAILSGIAHGETAPTNETAPPFHLEVLVDFVDDALVTEFTPDHIDQMMATLKSLGVTRVSWAYYGDGHGGFFMPSGLDKRWQNLANTYQNLGNPLRVATEAAHRHGLELYAYYKPYETGPAIALPEGTPEARAFGRIRQQGAWLTWFDPFVVENPDLRIKRLPGLPNATDNAVPICALKLVKQDDSPTRITAEHLQIWASDDNYQYKPLEVDFTVSEAVEPSPKEVRDRDGKLLTKTGDPVRTLTLSGFALTNKYVLVTTDFTEGPADFENAGTDILTALDSEGSEIPGVFYNGAMIYMRDKIDFRNWGLLFDCGYGRGMTQLDLPNTSGKQGVVAFARGRNEYLPGALCETEPAVRAYWLDCIQEMLDAGVDGVDLRVENHGTHTDYPEEYGGNEVILKACEARGGVTPENIAAVRGEAYTAFLRDAKGLLGKHNRPLRVNLNFDWFRSDPPANRKLAYPMNMDFPWREWIDAGLMDAAILRFYRLPFDAIFDDAVALEMTAKCNAAGIPITVNRYLKPTMPEEFERVRDDGRFAGYVLYEAASFITYDAEEQCLVKQDMVKELGKRVTGKQD